MVVKNTYLLNQIKMKKKTVILIMTLISSVLVTCTIVRQHHSYLDVMLEALARGDYSGQLCYNIIENAPSQWVLYCGNCDKPVGGRPVSWGGTSTCP